MGISLYGLTPATTYDALIKTGDNAPIDATLKPLSDGVGTNLPMEVSTTGVNFTNNLTQGGTALQPVLVSGTNIKTINGTSVLGSGDIVTPSTPPSGVSGAIQFSTGSAFGSDASNLFWDDTNNRLGVGTNVPTATIHTKGAGNTSATNALYVENSDSSQLLKLTNNGVLSLGLNFPKIAGSNVIGGFSGGFNCAYNNGVYFSVGENDIATMVMDSSRNVGIGTSSPTAKTHIKGSGSTSATTSLLVQNSSGTTTLNVKDDGNVVVPTWMGVGGATAQSGAGEKFIVSGAQIINGAAASGTFLIYQVGGANKIILGMEAAIGGGVNNAMTYVYGNNSHVLYTNGVERITTTGGGNVLIGTTTDVASSLMTLASTTKGFLPPRMTTTQINAIASPANGLEVYNTTLNCPCFYNGTSWRQVTNSAM